jgi:hypothetical protein|tara:strand:- start:101 stop:256 length:156 start_codon:yes stop_codon:yes gene_type:complete
MEKKTIKNLKIRPEFHNILKTYCKQRGLVMSKFLEKLIEKHCKDKKDIYGE